MRPQSGPCNLEQLRLLADDALPPGELAVLERHLEECGACRDRLDQRVGGDGWLSALRSSLTADPAGLAPASTLASAPTRSWTIPESLEFLAPSDWPDSLGRLGTYEVKGVLGRGGMGVVLKAFDPALNRNVAIKVLSAPLATSGAARGRFLREARAAAAVVHEHVVAVYAVVESSGLPFLVMEYIPGRSLQERIDRQGRLSLAEVLRIGMQTASGLAAAHAQGLVHRDVKPANILLEDGVERVRLTDFGLARAAADAAMTHSGVVAGTPHYMSPEQARGETVDARGDLFGLGSTLYAACAGHPPFRAESPLAVLRRVCDTEPRSLLEENSEVPEWLDAIVARLLAKDPARRFQTASEVADVLGRCLAHVQQPLASPLPEGLKRPPAVKRPAMETAGSLASLVALVVLAVVALAVWWRPMALRPEPTPRATTPPTAPSTSADSLSSESLQRLIVEAEARARSLQQDVLERRVVPAPDVFSEQGAALMREAEALEREIQSGRGFPASPNESRSNPDPRHER